MMRWIRSTQESPVIWLLKEGIIFHDIWFTYPGQKEPVLKGINLHIHPDEKIALVGANGSGKSTLINCCSDCTKRIGGRLG